MSKLNDPFHIRSRFFEKILRRIAIFFGQTWKQFFFKFSLESGRQLISISMLVNVNLTENCSSKFCDPKIIMNK